MSNSSDYCSTNSAGNGGYKGWAAKQSLVSELQQFESCRKASKSQLGKLTVSHQYALVFSVVIKYWRLVRRSEAGTARADITDS